ncbi:MAG TPA: NAD(P)/FAD-dependent oxidoreductase [Kofleriaceae bacterium]|nr:NAD(P)/FAD-dependent oxidoreductase [Kofleriaceae bacterium]
MDAPLSAIIVGAGFSGLCAGIELLRRGITDFVILEKAAGVGGTWRENTYPGAACDIPSHLYSYSFAPNPAWSRAYGGQAEILAYLEQCADRFGLRPHLRFHTKVERAVYDPASATWTVHPAGAPALTARALILGNGALHLPALPDLPGRDRFTGTAFHSARWDHSYPLDGKRVAVIGTGASTIQFLPEIAKRAGHVTVFQRTPPWIIGKDDRSMSRAERWMFKHVPGVHWLRRTGLYWLLEARVLAFAFSPKLQKVAEGLARGHLNHSVPDPVLREKLTPNYQLGCKRVLVSNDYYPALARANVSLETQPIAAIEPSGVRTADAALHEVDAIIYGTGFHAAEYLSAMQIVGAGGRELNAEWRAGVRSFLGINVSGFPNLFLLMGPNTGLGHNSMIFMIEAQARYAVQAIAAMRERALASLDVRPSVEQAFRDDVARQLGNTVWTSGCRSWYQAPDGDVLIWPGFTFNYWRRTRRVDLTNYQARALTEQTASRDAETT